MKHPFLILAALLCVVVPVSAQESEPAEVDIPTQALFPIPEQARHIIDARCVLCHGGKINGEVVTREDIDFTSDAAILKTLESASLLITVIEDDDMPQGAKLPREFRKDPVLAQQLDQLKSDYEIKEEKAVLMQWLNAVAAKAAK